MNNEPPIIDMRPDGSFSEAPRRTLGGNPFGGARPVVPLQAKLMLAAVVVTVVGVSIAVAAVAIWLVSMLLPVIIIAGAAAYGLYRYQRWQLFRRQSDLPQSNAYRPWQSGRFRQ